MQIVKVGNHGTLTAMSKKDWFEKVSTLEGLVTIIFIGPEEARKSYDKALAAVKSFSVTKVDSFEPKSFIEPKDPYHTKELMPGKTIHKILAQKLYLIPIRNLLTNAISVHHRLMNTSDNIMNFKRLISWKVSWWCERLPLRIRHDLVDGSDLDNVILETVDNNKRRGKKGPKKFHKPQQKSQPKG